jgi:hypothetical protein
MEKSMDYVVELAVQLLVQKQSELVKHYEGQEKELVETQHRIKAMDYLIKLTKEQAGSSSRSDFVNRGKAEPFSLVSSNYSSEE